MAGSSADTSRRRKFHRKSRLGCSNCKLRRVKCDETKPECKNCRSYGVLCSYRSNAGDLHVPREVITSASAASSDTTDSLELDGQCVMSLMRLGTQTAVSILDLDQRDVLQQALSTPYLMHAILAVSAIHDRYRGNIPIAGPTRREAYHSSQGASLFNRKLSGPIPPQDRDTLWMAATYLGIVAFCSNIPETPEECWPLKPDPSHLDWLRMTEAKMAIWELANPLQPGSLFRSMADEFNEMYTPLPTAPIEGAPPALLHLCHITSCSSATNNPYYTAVRLLAPLFNNMKPGTLARSKILSFTSQMQKSFRALLYERDPVALLLLALWYEKSRPHVWWLRHRSTIEYQAITLYLRRCQSENGAIMGLLSEIVQGSPR
ncbi:uncharacterized protein B0T15DRAFT_515217 [Chaetomium strumarium]|uniref:Zn(2)-C6 fungal-type domain-containing protein n=1 Tax=Chaetomium strumarium TaxID=1170767 RepID=A0AAJ0H028_9PEZI|nr:hypothetical protein B0T15DRAFT_515217 [Chaetomium strumarium]